MRLLSAFALLLCALAAPPAAAQDGDDSVRRVVLVDGTVYVGTVEDAGADPVRMVTRDGVSREFAAVRVREITPLIGGRFFRTDPVGTRLLIAPTARTQGRGEFRGDVTAVYPSVTYGASDRVDLLGSGFITFGDGLVATPLVGVKGQVVSRENLQVALGTSVVATIGGDGGGFGAIPYVVATIGDATGAVHLGAAGAVGGGFGNGIDVAQGVVLGLGADKQLNNGIKVFVEGYVGVDLSGDTDPGTGLLVVPGVRFFGERFAFDVVGFVATDFDTVVGFAPLPIRASYRF